MDIVCLLIWIAQLFIGIDAYINNKEIGVLGFVCAALVCSIYFWNLVVENKTNKFLKIFDIIALIYWIGSTIFGFILYLSNKKIHVGLFIFAVIVCIIYYIRRIVMSRKHY